MRGLPFSLLAGALFGLTLGCGSQGPKVAPAAGKVLYKGQPLADATLVFEPAGGEAKVAHATTDASGTFQVQTQITPQRTSTGAVPGDYRVTVSKFVPPGGMSETDYQKKVDSETAVMEAKGSVSDAERAPPKVELLGPQFSDRQKTKLTAKVEANGKNEFTFEVE